MEYTQSWGIRIIVVHRRCQCLAEKVGKLMLDVTVSKIRRFQRLPRNQLQIMTPLPQQEVGAHENRWGFIVSNVALLFEEQDVEILRYRECKRLLPYWLCVLDVLPLER